jgi:UDP-N-acetyl-2-amino-2-deoxyglucuronate dehydrogenase
VAQQDTGSETAQLPMNFAIVGCGRIAQRHAEHISSRGNLRAVCDVDFDRAQKLGSQYDAVAYVSIEDMLAGEPDIDIVAICSPNGHHREHSILALEAGRHVLCEKPMALSAHDCGEMIKSAERCNRRLFVVKQNRFNPPIAGLKEAIDRGVLGKLYSLQLSCFWNRNNDYYKDSWKGSRDLDGGTLYTQFSHFIDLLYWMVGDVDEVSAMTDNFGHQGTIEFEDTGVVVLRFQNGVLGTVNFTVNSYDGNMEGSLVIFGEKGTVKVGGQYLNELEYQRIEGVELETTAVARPPNEYGGYQGSMSNHDKVYDNLIDVFMHGASISTNSFEALKTVEIIEKIYRAAASRSR